MAALSSWSSTIHVARRLLYMSGLAAAIADVRQFSTQPSSPSIKAALRELYKRVHPDQFHQHPLARETNSRGFKLLQEYVAATKTGGGIGRTAGLPYHFVFYIQTDGEVGQAAPEAAGEDSEAGELPGHFKKVTLTLPPPTKAGPGDSLAPSTRKAFSRLLEACGIPSHHLLSSAAPDASTHHYSHLTSLREFVPAAAEQLHQAAAQQAGPRHQLGAVRTALHLGRGVVVAFAGDAASSGPVGQLALAQQLVGVLDGMPRLDMSGLRVMVGEAYGVDALGNIWLHAGDSAGAWTSALTPQDPHSGRQRQALLQQVRVQEAAVARALRISMLYTHPQLSLDPAYLEFLQRMAAAAAERGPVGGGRCEGVGVMVQPDPSQGLDAEEGVAGEGEGAAAGGGGRGGGGAGGEEAPAPSLDDVAGVVLIPISTSPQALYEALARLGPRAQAVLARAREEESAAATLRTAVERKLRLRRLSKDAGLAPERYRAACLRLMQHSQALTPLLGGLAVRVAEVNGLPPDRSFIDIAWDFQP